MVQSTPTHAPQAVLFDAYGTLFDVYSVAQLAEQLFPGHGTALSVLWRDKQIEYTRLVTTSNHGAHYRPFSELTRAALVYAIKNIAARACQAGSSGTFDAYFEAETDAHEDFKLSPAVNSKIDQLIAQYNQLTAFPENREVLTALKNKGITTGILSNGDPGMLTAVVASSGLGDLLDHVISVHPVRKFKTHPDAYALGEAACGLPARKIAFVSSNSWDALAATWYGYQTLWVNRQNMPFEELGTSPHRTGTSLRDILSFF